MIDAGRGREIGSFDVGGGIADAIALCPLLVSFYAGEGAGQGRAARAAVLVGTYVAVYTGILVSKANLGISAIDYQIEQREESRGSGS